MIPTTKKADQDSTLERLHALIANMSKEEQYALLKALEERSAKSKRKHQRKTFHATVDYTTNARTYKEFTKDISLGGVFIQTRKHHSVGDRITMTFVFPGHEKGLKVQGEIMRIDEEGIGVAFQSSQVQIEIIKSFVDRL